MWYFLNGKCFWEATPIGPPSPKLALKAPTSRKTASFPTRKVFMQKKAYNSKLGRLGFFKPPFKVSTIKKMGPRVSEKTLKTESLQTYEVDSWTKITFYWWNKSFGNCTTDERGCQTRIIKFSIRYILIVFLNGLKSSHETCHPKKR